jgi:hypothetical protein
MLSNICKGMPCTKISIRAARSMPPSNFPQHTSPQHREIKGHLLGRLRANTDCHQANAAANVGHSVARANLNEGRHGAESYDRPGLSSLM